VGIIEPGQTGQQTFTGTVDISGSQITNVVWVRGTNVGHAGGVTIVDYVTGAGHNMITTGILKQHTQGGAHTGITNTGGLTTDTATVTSNATVGGTLNVIGAVTLTSLVGTVVGNANLSTSAGDLGAAWQSWSPVWTNLTTGNGTTVASYIQTGKIVRFKAKFILGSTSSIGGNVGVNPPVAALAAYATSNAWPLGQCWYEDSGINNYSGMIAFASSSTSMTLYVYSASGTYVTNPSVTAAVPFNFSTGDIINIMGSYEAA
jgi:hypothetical protein